MARSEKLLIDVEDFKTLVSKGLKVGDADLAGFSVVGPMVSLVKAIGEPSARTMEFTISDDSVDRAGDVIRQDGWQLENFRRNPVVCLNHDSFSGLPVGRALSVTPGAHSTLSVAQFADRETYETADTVYRLLAGGFLNASSVGFSPITWEESNEDDGIVFLTHELLEWSVCVVPCNGNALVSARSKGISTAPLSSWADKALTGFSAKGRAAAELRRGLIQLRRDADPKAARSFAVRGKDAGEDASALVAARDTLAAAGTAMSQAQEALDALLAVPSGDPAEQAAARQASLDAVAGSCVSAIQGLTSVRATAVALGASKTATVPARRTRAATDPAYFTFEDNFESALKNITKADLERVVVAEISRTLMLHTGRVPENPDNL